MYSKQANGHVHELTQAQRTGLKHAAGELEEEKWLNGFRFLFPNIEGYLVPEHACTYHDLAADTDHSLMLTRPREGRLWGPRNETS
jgi:hypothetical protein